MRSSWVREDPNLMTGVPIRDREEETHGRGKAALG